ncbi:MAG: excinuclease ABC subunit C [Saprospiraceae bacterium]|nr:excinuclease ABC subunit C [Saprospiraceae bacterium]
MTNEEFKSFLPSIPKDPGVYRFVGESGSILYVGKAKNLRNRLTSYFGQRKDQHPKVKALTKHAHHIEFTLVETEHDALLLECTLIKNFQPPYNVMLKDGKGYSYICIKNERFPRVFFTRSVFRDGSTYFGPYTSKWRAGIILDLIKHLFPLRTCKFNLSQDLIDRNKYKVCLEYHIKNCNGPCQGFESLQEYNAKIDQIKNILRGSLGKVKQYMVEQMQRYAEELDFENAQLLKEKLVAFEDYQSKSTVVSTTIRDVDVFYIGTDEKFAYVNYLKVIEGSIVNAHTVEMMKNLNEDEADLLSYSISIIREKFNSIATEIIVPFEVSISEPNIEITVPKIGDKKKLLELSQRNVQHFLLQKKKENINQIKKETPAERILNTLKNDLEMSELPMHIECFDNSNLQGTNPVSSCVVFKNAKPSKKDYRHYNVKTVEGPNDFATMEEVVYRRYKRLISEAKPLPQLIIIDGGKGQLSSAVTSLKALGIFEKVTIVGVAKKLEEIFFPDDGVPLYINKKSESLKLIQQARNEAHRFAITFHRLQRSRNFINTSLTDIPGVGDVTAQKLLKHYGSVKKIISAGEPDVAQIVNKSVAKKIFSYINGNPEGDDIKEIETNK